jgi:putative addiction module killer protein
MMPNVTQYEQEDGVVPFTRWFDSLGVGAALKVRTAIAQMEAGNFGDHKSVGGGVWERRINFEKGYRIYFAKDGDNLVLLFWGGTKTRQQSDVEKAKIYLSEYKARKKRIAKKQDSLEQESKSKKTLKKSRRKK